MMYISDFDNQETEIHSEEALSTYLLRRPALDANHFVLYFEREVDQPYLTILVKGDASVLYYLEGDQYHNYGSRGNAESKEDATFYENRNGAELILAGEMVIHFEAAAAAALDYFRTAARPACISWMEL